MAAWNKENKDVDTYWAHEVAWLGMSRDPTSPIQDLHWDDGVLANMPKIWYQNRGLPLPPPEIANSECLGTVVNWTVSLF